MEEEESKTPEESAKKKYYNHFISLIFFGSIVWSIYDITVRGIVFWFFLVLMSLMVIFSLIAFKKIKVGAMQIFNVFLQIVIIGFIIYALIHPEHGSKVAVLIAGIYIVQVIQAFYLKNIKTSRGTDERDGAAIRK